MLTYCTCIVVLGRMGDESSEEGGIMSLAPRLLKAKLEDALTSKQEFEARMATMDEKLKQKDIEISDLKLHVWTQVPFTVWRIRHTIGTRWRCLVLLNKEIVSSCLILKKI